MADREAVSVVIPTRDRSARVTDTVRSTLAQRDVELEVVVVDDGSRDGTAEALEALGDERVTVVRNASSRGVANARNRGIERAAHPWIAFLDDDDRWSPDKLRMQLDAARMQGADFVYAAGVAVRGDGRLLYASPAAAPDELRRDIRSRNVVFAGSSNVLARADLVRRLGGFDERLHHIADWDMWIRLTEAGRPATCPEPLVAYVVHDANMHSTAIDAAGREGRLLRTKHAASSLPGRFDAVVFRGWIADGRADSGRHGRAAVTYAVTALRYRSRPDVRRAAGSALRAVGLRRAAGLSVDSGGPAPDWLSIRP
jgi:glycosyltransferase involved in cell wall biosynthesis